MGVFSTSTSPIRIATVTCLITVLALVTAAARPSAATAASGYCSPTGDYCYSVKKTRGVWRIAFGTFSFQGRVRVCVTAPDTSRACKNFRLRPNAVVGDIYEINARWSAHFPSDGRGRHRVSFTAFGSRLGPGVSFVR